MKKLVSLLVLLLLSLSACNSAPDTISTIVGNELNLTKTLSVSETSLSTSKSTITNTSSPIATSTSNPTPTLLPTPGYKPQLWKTYSFTDIGLSPPNTSISVFYIYDIEESENGDMWFASTYGLVRFDGQAWELIKSDPGITNKAFVEKSPSGEIWFTLSDGVYSVRDEKIQKRMSYEDFGVDIFDVTGFCLSPSGQAWIALRDSIWFYGGDDWNVPESNNELPFDFIGFPVIDQNAIVYVWGNKAKTETGEAASKGDTYGGLSFFDGSQWVYFDQKGRYGISPSDETKFYAEPLIVDGQNHIWFYLWREGLFEYTDGDFTLHVPHDDVYSLYHPITMEFDQLGTLWLGNKSEGAQLIKYVPGSEGFQFIDGSFAFFVEVQGEGIPINQNELEGILPFEYVSALHVDSNNALWIATELGVSVFDINID